MSSAGEAHAASFRDPSGFVFWRDGALLRQVNASYQPAYEQLMGSGLYQALCSAGALVPHAEEPGEPGLTAAAWRVLRPEPVPFVSYPYEWCFGQLRDAALLTLRIQREALQAGMSLKDASAYNIQFRGAAPVLIDTLSFAPHEAGRPWVAYRQFCQHFLAPLSLMARRDVRLARLLRADIDGVPLDLASRLLPLRTWFSPGLLAHVHLHAAAQRRYAAAPAPARRAGMSRRALLGLLDSLEGAVRGLSWAPRGTAWADYYAQTNYSEEAMEAKGRLVAEMLDAIQPAPRVLWDLGANTGRFSRLASRRGIHTVAWDADPAAVEQNHRAARHAGETHLLPLLQDLTNPSPEQGWAQEERRSLLGRGPADAVLALALLHHLAIGNHVPLDRIARFLRAAGPWLIVEFVPATDSQARRLLAGREGLFGGYSREGFLDAFAAHFTVLRAAPVPGTERTLYLMRGHPA